jgi:competence ComEA-like helix-hairpin-helix protein
MNYQKLKTYFIYTRSQRAGLFALFIIVIIFQGLYYFIDFSFVTNEAQKQQQWISVQSEIDSLGSIRKTEKPKIYSFNPNFITDFKGYKLGMSVAEIDRLLDYRKTNRYVNSAKEFQQVTKVSDSLLKSLATYFKFPDWVTQKKSAGYSHKIFEKPKIVVIDINLATKEELKKVYGIGDGLSERILKEKEKFGGFVSMEQMNDVWGLSDEVIEKLNQSFNITSIPTVKKIAINNASIKELMKFPYFRYDLAKSIVTYRSMNGEIKSVEDLIKISGFPVDKVRIIALYLEF